MRNNSRVFLGAKMAAREPSGFPVVALAFLLGTVIFLLCSDKLDMPGVLLDISAAGHFSDSRFLNIFLACSFSLLVFLFSFSGAGVFTIPTVILIRSVVISFSASVLLGTGGNAFRTLAAYFVGSLLPFVLFMMLASLCFSRAAGYGSRRASGMSGGADLAGAFVLLCASLAVETVFCLI